VPTFSIRSLKINELVCSVCPYCERQVSEREMKRVVLNRKNSLFRRQPTRRANRSDPGQLDQHLPTARYDPQLYFMQLLVNLPSWPASDLDAWLPDRWKQAHEARCAALGISAPPTT